MVPADTQLTPRPAEFPAWDSQPAEARRIYSRFMENYAGYLAFADDQIGRLIDMLDQTGQRDNTLIFYIVGDNGASAEGGPEGTFNDLASLIGIQMGLASVGMRIDEIGGPNSAPHVPESWAWAMNTPFQWAKMIASHFGGTRNPLVISWPGHIKDPGGLRSQFHHVIDIAPTILAATGVPAPDSVNGIAQKPIEGTSLVYCFGSPHAKSPRTTQYFEMFGNRAIYDNGWVAAILHGLPWENKPSGDFTHDRWELYNINEGFSEYKDVSAHTRTN